MLDCTHAGRDLAVLDVPPWGRTGKMAVSLWFRQDPSRPTFGSEFQYLISQVLRAAQGPVRASKGLVSDAGLASVRMEKSGLLCWPPDAQADNDHASLNNNTPC